MTDNVPAQPTGTPLDYEHILIEAEAIAASWHKELDANQVYKLGRQIIRLVDKVRDGYIDELQDVYGEIAKLKEAAKQGIARLTTQITAKEVEIGTLKTDKHFLEHELAATVEELTAVKRELAGYIGEEIGRWEWCNPGKLADYSRYRELTGRNYNEEDTDAQ